MEWFRSCVAGIGARIIYALIFLFGRRTSFEENPWLRGPLGGEYIGDQPYEEVAEAEDLELTRHSREGGLIPDFSTLEGGSFKPGRIQSEVKDFYENTAEYRMDVWSQTHFPANVALWLLVTTISRTVNQLNFPTSALDTAGGITSEIVLLKDREGKIRYTGWFRKIAGTDRVLYTGFYMVSEIPGSDGPCVKVVFPMPDGNATVILLPGMEGKGEFTLDSSGSGFGDAGFYRIRKVGEALRVWRIKSLKEKFRVFVDGEGVLRCDHRVSFLGFHVLSLHYRIERPEGVGNG